MYLYSMNLIINQKFIFKFVPYLFFFQQVLDLGFKPLIPINTNVETLFKVRIKYIQLQTNIVFMVLV